MKRIVAVLCFFAAFLLLAHPASALNQESSRAAFDLYKTMEGKWIGKSTKGWTEEITYRTIAGGSVLVEDSFNAHPNESMLTTVTMDNDRVLLTHYCIAKNQPRLQLSSYEPQSKTMIFTFLDGTNMPDRNKGHMDKVVLQFIDQDHVISQWTWYQDGQERWMEKIELERVK